MSESSTKPRRQLIDIWKERALAAEKEVVEKEFEAEIRTIINDLEYISELKEQKGNSLERQESYEKQAEEKSEQIKFYQATSVRLRQLIENEEESLAGLKQKGFPDKAAMIKSGLISSPKTTTASSSVVKNNSVKFNDHSVTPESRQHTNVIPKGGDKLQIYKEEKVAKLNGYYGASPPEDLFPSDSDTDPDESPIQLRQMSGKPCRYHERGYCRKGDLCPFIHYIQNENKRKTKMCRDYERGYCLNGDDCDFAHGFLDLREDVRKAQPYQLKMKYQAGKHPEPCNNQQCDARLSLLKYKTQRCRDPKCPNRDRPANCRYAHTEDELRRLPKSEICQRWNRGLCKFDSDQCVYAHGEDELGQPRYSGR